MYGVHCKLTTHTQVCYFLGPLNSAEVVGNALISSLINTFFWTEIFMWMMKVTLYYIVLVLQRLKKPQTLHSTYLRVVWQINFRLTLSEGCQVTRSRGKPVFSCGKAMTYYVTLQRGKQQDGRLNMFMIWSILWIWSSWNYQTLRRLEGTHWCYLKSIKWTKRCV